MAGKASPHSTLGCLTPLSTQGPGAAKPSEGDRQVAKGAAGGLPQSFLGLTDFWSIPKISEAAGPLDSKLQAQLQPLFPVRASLPKSVCFQATPLSSSGSTKANLFWAVWGWVPKTSLTESSSFEWTSRLKLSEIGQHASGSHTFPVAKRRFQTTEVRLLQDSEP